MSVSVKDFGAIGNFTNDTVAIQNAINAVAAAGGGDVVMPPGNYNVSSTIEVKPRVHLKCSHGCTIRPTTNNHVVQLRKNAQISGARIETYDFAEFSKSCIYLDGEDKFDFGHNTSIRSMMLYGRSTRIKEHPPSLDGSPTIDHDSTGIYMYAKGEGHNVVAVHVYDVNIVYFGKGIHLHAEDSGMLTPEKGTSQWVNGNQFDMIGFSDNQYDIYMTGGGPRHPVHTGVFGTGGNTFSNIQSQPTRGITRQSLVINGGNNRIMGKIWDIHVIESGIIARMTNTSQQNIISTNLKRSDVLDFGKLNKIDAIYETDDSFAGTMTSGTIPPPMSDRSMFVGNQDDFLAFADKRYTVTMAGSPPDSGSLSNVFNLQPSSAMRFDTVLNSAPTVIEIMFPGVLYYVTNFGIAFSPWDESPKYAKLERFYQGEWTTVYDLTDLTARTHIIHNKLMTNVSGLRITVSGTNAASGKMRISRIFAQCGDSTGAAYLQAGGGSLYGPLNMRDNCLTIGNKTALPAASESLRGSVITLRGTEGVEDSLHICVKNNAGAYVWKKVTLT